MKNVFISYAWESEEHKQWVLKLADTLEKKETINIILDQYDIGYQDDKNLYMENSASDSDVIIIVSTQEYKRKADQRLGGVGIETRLAVPKYWDRLESGLRSGIIIAAREKNSAPNYLRNQFYIDFSDDKSFNQKVIELENAIHNKDRIPRPQKQTSFEKNTQLYNFTRAEDLLKLAHKRRTAIITGNEGIDFSGGNRIRFELWKTDYPTEIFFIILFDNITINQTINRACDTLKAKGINPKLIDILRPRTGEDGLTSSIIKKNDIQAEVREYTYTEFLWKFCIDDELKNNIGAYSIPYYVEQPAKVRSKTIELTETNVTRLLFNEITSDKKSAAHLILAPGGMGKTSLCQYLVSELKERQPDRAVTHIQAEQIRDRLEKQESLKVETIFDIYAIYISQVLSENHYDKNSFELAVLSGNLIVIIDGIDEIASILGQNFNKDSFFKSIEYLHNQLGESSVVITSRTLEGFNEKIENNENIVVYYLQGFNEKAYNRYFSKRFSKKTNNEELINKCNRISEKIISLSGSSSREILPFFVDLIAKINEEEEIGIDDNFEFTTVDYPSNKGVIDKLVAAVLRREEKRHRIKAGIECAALREAAVEQGNTINKSYLKEWTEIYCPDQHEHKYEKILLSPLLLQTSSAHTQFRYDFLHGYFYFLYITSELNAGRAGTELIKAIRNTSKKNDVIKLLKEYYENNKQSTYNSLKTLAKKFREKLKKSRENKDTAQHENYRHAISSLITLYSKLATPNRETLTNAIHEFYEILPSQTQIRIDDLHINSDIGPVNFDNLSIWHSTFENWPNFVTSRFTNTLFYHCSFDIQHTKEKPSESLNQRIFDQDSCEISCFSWLLAELSQNSAKERQFMADALGKFLKKFFQNGRFTDTKKQYIYFNESVHGLKASNFHLLLSHQIIEVCREKSDETYYQIPERLHNSVYCFLMNSIIDQDIHRIINVISGK